jgi:hypothetical protein
VAARAGEDPAAANPAVTNKQGESQAIVAVHKAAADPVVVAIAR